ncbi:hypothetical protein [Thermus thermophilus]|uniref:hypothetical protein n=1 Tax=Thermus thermophilus TaxID=274 RepID=UPI001FCDE534|nr:hypothetical protein [Thermus thermophilus]BDG22612.1 hypothetical protein TthSNM17_22740 [Thermus thermophilus]
MSPEALLAMRDPLGAPIHPAVLQVLLVVTYVLHIFFVTAAVGSLFLGLYGLRRPEENWRRLAQVAVRLSVQATGLGITMGIAPLLFVQVIYDPAWYTATTLMGLWTVLFIPVVALAYLLLYVLYLRGNVAGVGYLSLALLLLAGFTMHSLANAGLYPSRFLEWYAPGGVVDTGGTRFLGYDLPRFAALLFGQAALSLGVMLHLFAWYFRRREDVPADFLAFVERLGQGALRLGGVLFAGFGLLWALTQGRELGFAVLIALVALGVGGLFYLHAARATKEGALGTLGLYLGALLLVGVVREALRAGVWGRLGYSVWAYPFVWDWGSILYFVVTAVAAVPVIVYLAQVLYASGNRPQGEDPSPRVERFGDLGVKLLVGWFLFYFALGIYVTLRSL